MATHVLDYVRLPDRDLKEIGPQLGKNDRLEVQLRIHRKIRGRGRVRDRDVELPQTALALIQTLVDHLLRGERVAVLAEQMELSPTQAAEILGISRPLVVHRMDVGDLPFRYVGAHRRTTMKAVLELKAKLDERQKAMDALADDTEELMRDHEL